MNIVEIFSEVSKTMRSYFERARNAIEKHLNQMETHIKKFLERFLKNTCLNQEI